MVEKKPHDDAATAPGPARERTLELMRAMLKNAGVGIAIGCSTTVDPVPPPSDQIVCDPLPPPVECQNEPTTTAMLVEQFYVDAHWLDDSGTFRVRLTVQTEATNVVITGATVNGDDFPVLSIQNQKQLTGTFTPVLPVTSADVVVSFDCTDGGSEQLNLRLNLSGTPTAQANIPVTPID